MKIGTESPGPCKIQQESKNTKLQAYLQICQALAGGVEQRSGDVRKPDSDRNQKVTMTFDVCFSQAPMQTCRLHL